MSIYSGIQIIEDANLPEFTPVIELSYKVMVSDKFRKETNEWYLKMFGKKRTMYMVSGKYLTHPNTVRALKWQMEKNNA